MPQATGSLSRLIYDEETTFKQTPAVPAARVLAFISENFTQKRNTIKSNVIRSTRNPQKASLGNKDASGSINTELAPSLGKFFKHALGSVVTTGTGPSYTHTFKIGSLPVGLCLEKGFTNIAVPKYFLYNGVRINKLSLEYGPEGMQPINMDFVGAGRNLNAATFDAAATDPGHLPFQGFKLSITEGGVAIATVSKLTLDIENDLDNGVYCIGGDGERRYIPEGATLISGNLTALFEDDSLLQKAIGYTESSLVITAENGTGDGTAGNESLVVSMPELIYGENDPVISGPKGVLVELPFSAFYENDAGASAISMVLQNAEATI